MKKILPLFSYIFHPIFIPLFGTFLYFYFDGESYVEPVKKYVYLQIAIVTFFIPLTIFYLLKTLGVIDSIMVSKASQRKLPMIIQVILVFILIKKTITVEGIPELYYFLLGGLLSTLLAFFLLYLNIKASMHLLAMSTLTIFIIGLSIHFQTNSLLLISFLILMNGVVASSRLQMNAHTYKELIIGFCIGIIPQTLLLSFWL